MNRLSTFCCSWGVSQREINRTFLAANGCCSYCSRICPDFRSTIEAETSSIGEGQWSVLCTTFFKFYQHVFQCYGAVEDEAVRLGVLRICAEVAEAFELAAVARLG